MDQQQASINVPLIVIDNYSSNASETLLTTLKNLSNASDKYEDNVLIWDSTGGSAQLIPEDVQIISHNKRLFNSGEFAKKAIEDHLPHAATLVVDSFLELNPDIVTCFMEKWKEYDEEMILCTQGLRLFPHQLYTERKQFWLDGRFTRFHDNTRTDREVHLFHIDGGGCVFPTQILIETLTPGIQTLNGYEWQKIDDFRISTIARSKLRAHIWKVQIDLINPRTELFPLSPEALIELGELYDLFAEINWPENLFQPFLLSTALKPRSKATIWEEGFCGVNMSAESVELDFSAARGYGASVVRFGAVNDAKDLSFMVNDIDEGSSETDKIHLSNAIPRLKKSIRRAGDAGLKVVLTLCDLPGRNFLDTGDERMWRSADYRQRIADLWATIAADLSDLRDVIIGYDVVNEPFTPDDSERSFDCPMTGTFTKELTDLYHRAITAIRNVDTETMVILESSYWASPKTFPYLKVWEDQQIVYSFHFYAPNLYTCRYENDGKHGYPGRVPMWKEQKWPETWPRWDKQRIQSVIQPVVDWQKANSIPASRIFVGEFGVARELPGAQRYLAHVSETWRENDWSSCLFSFRDNEWDAMDYELGEDITNQLNRQPTDMLQTVAKHFY